MKEMDIFWRRVIETKFGTIDKGRFPGLFARPRGKGLEKKIIWEEMGFENVLNGELGMGIELVFGGMCG